MKGKKPSPDFVDVIGLYSTSKHQSTQTPPKKINPYLFLIKQTLQHTIHHGNFSQIHQL